MAKLYFIKLNVSAEVFDMKTNKNEILTEIFQALTTVNYTMEIEYVYEEDENTKYVKQQEYELEIKDIEDTLLVADFIRLTHVPINKKNEKTGEIYPTSTETYEPIRFIVDIKKEIIAFYTKQRFGYRQFQKYFEQYLNNIIYLYKNKQDYINVDDDEIKYVILKLITTSYDIEEFKLLLETKGNVKNLGYSFIFPNGNEDLINGVNECTEGLIDKYKEAQINEVNKEIISNTEKGLLIQSQPVNEFFEDIKKIKKGLDLNTNNSSESLDPGYVEINAKTKDGENLSTQDEYIYTQNIDDKNKNIHGLKTIYKDIVSKVMNMFF